MEQTVLEAQKRDVVGKKVKLLRQAGRLPGVVYARDMQPLSISVDTRSFAKIITGEHGRNVLINLNVDGGQALTVITHAIDLDPLNGRLRHVDFHKISMTEKIKAKVHVELTGIPTGVKDEGGVMVHGLREIEVRCLPTAIPDKFVLDIAAMKIGDSIPVSQLNIPAGVEIVTDPEITVVNISAPTKDEAPAPSVMPAEGEAAAAAAPGAEAVPATAQKAGAAPAAEAKGGKAEAPKKEAKGEGKK